MSVLAYASVFAMCVLLSSARTDGMRVDATTAVSICSISALQDYDIGDVFLYPGSTLTYRRVTHCEHGVITRSRYNECNRVTLVDEVRKLPPGEVTYGAYSNLMWFTVDLAQWKFTEALMWEDDMLIARLDPSRVGEELLVGCRPGTDTRERAYDIADHKLELQCLGVVEHYETVFSGYIPSDAGPMPRRNSTM